MAAIAYLDGPRLKRGLLAAARWVQVGREELNRINVFPVPDGDTGTNFWFTTRSIAEALQRLGDAPLPDVSRAAAQAAVTGSRGNSGMMLSHFLVGFDEGVGARFRLDGTGLAAAIRAGFTRLESSLEDPVEGTILTVCRDTAGGAEAAAMRGEDIGGVVRASLTGAEASLQKTPELLADLKKAGVVDAGGKGFVRLIEGVVRLMDGQAIEEAAEDSRAFAQTPAATFDVVQDRDFRFCSEVLVRGNSLPGSAEARTALHELQGGSLQVLRTGDLLRVHVHLNDPEPLFALAGRWGEIVTRKAEDMREQHQMLAAATRPVAILTDSTCDLPEELVDRHGVSIVPLQVLLGDRAAQDRIEIRPEAIARSLREGRPLSTSQPLVSAFTEGFEHARAGAEEVVAILLSGALSGTFANAEAARRVYQPGGIHLVDSRNVSLGLGLLVLRAAELAEAGWSPADIAAECRRLRGQSGVFIAVDRLDNLIKGGRVSRVKGWLGHLLDAKPILTLDEAGRVGPVDRVRGRAALLPRVLELLDEALPAQRERLRMGVVHVDAEATAGDVRTALERRYRPLEIIVAAATPVIGVHAGPDTWGVFWQLEDGVPSRRNNPREKRL